MPFFRQSRTPFSTEGMKLRGHRAAEDLVDELEAAAPRERLHAEPGVAVLAAAARLLLVLALPLGAPLDRLLVGDARRQQQHVDVVLALHALDHHLHVHAAHAGDQQLLGLGIEVMVDGGVFLGDAGQRGGDLVLVAARLGLDGEVDGRLRERDPGQLEGLRFLAERVAGVGVLELGHHPDLARAERLDRLLVLAHEPVQYGRCARGRRAPD